MNELKLCQSDYRFMSVIWDNEPLSSHELVELCARKLGWKKSTTYTVLKRLCEKGLFQNSGAVVEITMSREEYYARKSESFVEETFQGSLPAFLAAFTARKPLKPEEVAQLRQMVARYGEE